MRCVVWYPQNLFAANTLCLCSVDFDYQLSRGEPPVQLLKRLLCKSRDCLHLHIAPWRRYDCLCGVAQLQSPSNHAPLPRAHRRPTAVLFLVKRRCSSWRDCSVTSALPCSTRRRSACTSASLGGMLMMRFVAVAGVDCCCCCKSGEANIPEGDWGTRVLRDRRDACNA